jgi:hypothetical protein
VVFALERIEAKKIKENKHMNNLNQGPESGVERMARSRSSALRRGDDLVKHSI